MSETKVAPVAINVQTPRYGQGPHFRRSAEGSPGGPPSAALQVRGLRKTYRRGASEVPVLRGVDLEIRRGEFLAVVGQSGSGKSTLLHLLGSLDQPDAGEILLDGQRIDNVSQAAREHLRSTAFGMVFQFYHLLPELSALENVLLPGMIRHGAWPYLRGRRALRDRAQQLLAEVGLAKRTRHRPSQLSGGEMQRVAIARALVNEPRFLLADEPTGNLDRATGEEILRILRRLNTQRGLTIVMVTHDDGLARQADSTVRLLEGRVQPA